MRILFGVLILVGCANQPPKVVKSDAEFQKELCEVVCYPQTKFDATREDCGCGPKPIISKQRKGKRK